MPFIQTALLNAEGDSRSSSGGDFIHHFTGVRMRVVGSGILRPTLRSPDAVVTQTLPTITMAATNRISPFVLSNFNQERVQLKLETTDIDEIFRINRIVLFARPVATMEPA
jgi:hypothetical protein